MTERTPVPCKCCGTSNQTLVALDFLGEVTDVDAELLDIPIADLDYSVRCGCGVSGPRKGSKAAAIAGWNSLMVL